MASFEELAAAIAEANAAYGSAAVPAVSAPATAATVAQRPAKRKRTSEAGQPLQPTPEAGHPLQPMPEADHPLQPPAKRKRGRSTRPRATAQPLEVYDAAVAIVTLGLDPSFLPESEEDLIARNARMLHATAVAKRAKDMRAKQRQYARSQGHAESRLPKKPPMDHLASNVHEQLGAILPDDHPDLLASITSAHSRVFTKGVEWMLVNLAREAAPRLKKDKGACQNIAGLPTLVGTAALRRLVPHFYGRENEQLNAVNDVTFFRHAVVIQGIVWHYVYGLIMRRYVGSFLGRMSQDTTMSYLNNKLKDNKSIRIALLKCCLELGLLPQEYVGPAQRALAQVEAASKACTA